MSGNVEGLLHWWIGLSGESLKLEFGKLFLWLSCGLLGNSEMKWFSLGSSFALQNSVS